MEPPNKIFAWYNDCQNSGALHMHTLRSEDAYGLGLRQRKDRLKK